MRLYLRITHGSVMNILYICMTNHENSASEYLSWAIMKSMCNFRCNFFIYGENADKKPAGIPIASFEQVRTLAWDCVLVQNSECFYEYEEVFNRLKDVPKIFFGYDETTKCSVNPANNVFRIFTATPRFHLSQGVPAHLICPISVPLSGSRIKAPVRQYQDGLVLYFPTGNNTNNERRVITALMNHCRCLKVVSNRYKHYISTKVSSMELISREKSKILIRKAEVVIASGHDALKAVSLSCPTIIAGDHGLGGLVTVENYNLFKKYNFQGRAGGYPGEYIPLDLLTNLLNEGISFNANREELIYLRNSTLSDYPFNKFQSALISELKRLDKVSLLVTMDAFLMIKPLLIRRLESVCSPDSRFTYIEPTLGLFLELDTVFFRTLSSCNGKLTVAEIAKRHEIKIERKRERRIFFLNLKLLWQNRIVDFC